MRDDTGPLSSLGSLTILALQGNQQEDPLKQLADKLRSKTGIEERAAILQDKRVDVFRGKEFAAYLRKHEELMQPFVSKGAPLINMRSIPLHRVGPCLPAVSVAQACRYLGTGYELVLPLQRQRWTSRCRMWLT